MKKASRVDDAGRTGSGRQGGGGRARSAAGWGPAFRKGLVTAALAAVAIPTGPVVAQDPGERPDTVRACRCVDADGEVIEECRCLMRGEGWAMAFGEDFPDVAAWSGDFGQGFFRALAPSTSFAWGDRSDRARLGVLVSVEQEAEYESEGVHLQEVTEGAPAWEAGLRDGDIVVSLNGRSVFEPLPAADEEEAIDLDRSVPVQRFLALVDELEPDEEVEVVYLREGERRTATVVPERTPGFRLFGPHGDLRMRLDTLEGDLRWEGDMQRPGNVRIRGLRDVDALRERGELFERRGPLGDLGIRGLGDGEVDVVLRGLDPCFGGGDGNVVYGLGGDRCVDGLRLQELNPQLAEYFGVGEGVLVTEVLEGTSLGPRAGDVIQSIGGRTVEDTGDVRRILRSYETDEPVEMVVVRRGEQTEVRGMRRQP